MSLDSDAIGSLIEKLDPNELSRSLAAAQLRQETSPPCPRTS